MSNSKDSPAIREAVGIFFDAEHLKTAIAELVSAGFERSEIGLLAGEHTVRQSLGDLYTQTNAFADSPNAPRTAFVARKSVGDMVHDLIGDLFFYGATTAAGAAVASAAVLGGALVAAATGVAAIGAVTAIMGVVIHQSDAEYLEEQLDEGHLLLFVRTRDAAKEAKAIQTLTQHGAFRPKLYSIAATS